MELASIFDPTGILTIAAAFVMPIVISTMLEKTKTQYNISKNLKTIVRTVVSQLT
jgi:hypothetical protein